MLASNHSTALGDGQSAERKRTEQLMAISSRVCVLARTTANAIAADIEALDDVPIELGEMYEDLANAFMKLADQVRLKQQ